MMCKEIMQINTFCSERLRARTRFDMFETEAPPTLTRVNLKTEKFENAAFKVFRLH